MSNEWGAARCTALTMEIFCSILFSYGVLKTVLSKNFFPPTAYKTYVFFINFSFFAFSMLSLLIDVVKCEDPNCMTYLYGLDNVFYIIGSNLVLLLTINRYKIFSMALLNPRRMLLLRILEVIGVLLMSIEAIWW
jgi:hypothetical protein